MRRRRTRTVSTSWIARAMSRVSAGSCGRRASTSCRSSSTCSRGDMSLVGPRPCLDYETEEFAEHHFERFLDAARADRPVAGHGTRSLDLRRSARHGRRLRPRLDARPRSSTPAQDPALTRPNASGRMTLSAFPENIPYEPVRIGVVGLGYWGPNLIRNLHDARDVRAALDLRPRRGASRRDRTALSRRSASTHAVRRAARRPAARGGR